MASSKTIETLTKIMQTHVIVGESRHPMPEDIARLVHDKLDRELGRAAEIVGNSLRFEENRVPSNDVSGIWGFRGANRYLPEYFLPDSFYGSPSTQFPAEKMRELYRLFNNILEQWQRLPETHLMHYSAKLFAYRAGQINRLIEITHAISNFIGEDGGHSRLTSYVLHNVCSKAFVFSGLCTCP